MKRFIISFVLFFAMGAIYAESGTLTVTLVESTPVTGITVITYDLTTQIPVKVSQTYNISVRVSFDGGSNYAPVPPAHLSDDVANVSPGNGKKITWNGGASFPNTYSTEAKVKLTATSNVFICGESTVTFTYNGSEVTYGTVMRANGSCWLDRNLGATQIATSHNDAASYGDLLQWGRFAEGHQVRTNTEHYAGPVSTSVPNAGNNWDGKFITSGSDWLSPKNDNLWQGGAADNNPCPPEWRVPTKAEWDAELVSWSSNDAAGAYGSPLKLPVAGYRGSSSGLIFDAGSVGGYWSSAVDNLAQYLYFRSDAVVAGMGYNDRANGYSVRCIKN